MGLINPLKTIFPVYHTVSDTSLAHIKHLHPVKTKKEFEHELDFFLKFYKPIDIGYLLCSLKNLQPIKERSFLLTFDDGLSQCYDIIAPILKRKGLTSVFFVNTSFIDNKELFFRYKASVLIEKVVQTKIKDSILSNISEKYNITLRDPADLKSYILSINYKYQNRIDELAGIFEVDFNSYLQNIKPYMTFEQIDRLSKEGFYIGSHSCDHPLFNELKLEEQMKQIADSFRILENTLHLKYKLFAFPFTDFNVPGALFEKMYTEQHIKTDLSFGTAGMKADKYVCHNQRIPMERFNAPGYAIVLFEYLYWMLKMPLRKNRIIR
jgi:peptidoglycan/xylan/chitin deacetylase (PgdA/CDA1 family)